MRTQTKFITLIAVFIAFAPFSIAAESNCNPVQILKGLVPERDFKLNLKPHELELQSLGSNLVKSAQSGETITYFVDTLDQVHFAKGNHIFDEVGDFYTIKKTGGNEPFVIKESGYFKFNPEKKEFLFESKRGWDLAPDEADAYLATLAKSDPELKISRVANPAAEKAKVIKCLDAMSAQNKGKNFIMDSIVSSNVVTLAGVVTNELAGNHLLSTDEGRRLVASDLIANNISSLITGPIVKRAVLGNVSVIRDFATRTTVDYLTNVGIKKPIYNHMRKKKPEDENKKSLGDRLVPYDTGFGVVRFFPKRALDRALVYQLPRMMVDSCLKGSPLSVIASPRMIRIADRYTWGLIYLGGRKGYLNATEEK